MIVGEGNLRYEVVVGWEQLPNGWSHGDVAGVATDSQDNVYVFNRSEHPVIVYDTDGKFLSTWGDEKTYPRPHGITIVDDVVYVADDTDHTVRKCTLDGKILNRRTSGYNLVSGNAYLSASGDIGETTKAIRKTAAPTSAATMPVLPQPSAFPRSSANTRRKSPPIRVSWPGASIRRGVGSRPSATKR